MHKKKLKKQLHYTYNNIQNIKQYTLKSCKAAKEISDISKDLLQFFENH